LVTGQAVGMAGALLLKRIDTPRELSISNLQSVLASRLSSNRPSGGRPYNMRVRIAGCVFDR
jgi:hypothetical protein